MTGAVFGDLGVSLLVAGAAFADVGASHVVAGAAFGDVGVSLLVAGEAFAETWLDSRNGRVRGRRNIWGSWRVTLVAPRNVNDVSYVSRINHESHFSWQAQYLVRLEGDSFCSAQSKWRFICEQDQS